MKFPASLGALAMVAASMGTAATALTLAQAATPAETPPGSYSKDVYVDSRGCVYVRASIGSAVNWVPRLSRDRETVVCGMTPSAAVASTTATPPAPPAPPPPAAVMAARAPSASAMHDVPAPQPASYAMPVPGAGQGAGSYVGTGTTAVTRTMEVTCPTDGSSARVRIGGDTVAVSCPPGMTRATSYVVTHADGSRSRLVAHPAQAGTGLATGHAQPGGRVIIGGVPPGAPNTAFGNGYGITTSAGPVDPVPNSAYTAVPAATGRPVQIPAGYRPAWEDDRLNPYRGPRTPYGDAQMGAVLDTSKVPMTAAETTAVRTATVRTVVVSKSQPDAAAPAPKVAPGARYVQVGAFGVAGNATKALANLRGLGFGAATARTRSGLTLVMAGPFASTADLKRALNTLRGYYPDAYTRG